MPVTTNFAGQSGDVPASQLDDAFALAAAQTDLVALQSTVTGLPGSATPLAPSAAGAAGSDPQFSREDHRHPVQSAAPNIQTGTTYTVQTTDNGGIVELNNPSAITVTMPNNMSADFSCMFVQSGAGQVTFVAQSGAVLRSYNSLAKTAGQWALVTGYVRVNSGGSAAEWVIGGALTS